MCAFFKFLVVLHISQGLYCVIVFALVTVGSHIHSVGKCLGDGCQFVGFSVEGADGCLGGLVVGGACLLCIHKRLDLGLNSSRKFAVERFHIVDGSLKGGAEILNLTEVENLEVVPDAPSVGAGASHA